MVCEVILPILMKMSIPKYEFVYGYRHKNYYIPTVREEFIFVNIGMFAVLEKVESTEIGEICNPTETLIISDLSPDNKLVSDYVITNFSNDKNILSKIPSFKEFLLFGIADTMAFITPDAYPKASIDELIEKLDE